MGSFKRKQSRTQKVRCGTERLIQLVCHGGGHLAHCTEAGCVQQFELQFAKTLLTTSKGCIGRAPLSVCLG